MKIFTATPMAVLNESDQDYNFFCRDMGLTCYALREQGVESQVVLLDFPRAKKHPDILRATLQDMENAQWWKSLGLDAVVLGAWAAPRYTAIARAVKNSGTRLMVRCDSGGPYSQWQMTPAQVLYVNHLGPKYRGHGTPYAWLSSLARSLAGYIPAYYEKKVLEHMAYADVIMNETPEGVRCLKELLCRYGQIEVAARVQYVPHPVRKEMTCRPGLPKQKRIIAVGRWQSYQKNTPLLIQSLFRALNEHPDYEAHIFGSGTAELQALVAKASGTIKNRICIRGKIPNEELVKEYQASRIFFAPSRSESFNIAAAEALSCGCSFAGSGHIFSFRNFVSKNTGTLARKYAVESMAQALSVEIVAWDLGLRNPSDSAAQWAGEVGQSAVAGRILSALSGLPQERRANESV